MEWGKPETKCTVDGYYGYYTGDVLWSNATENQPLSPIGNSDDQYIDLTGLTPWTFYNVCVAAGTDTSGFGFFDCCVTTTDEAGKV